MFTWKQMQAEQAEWATRNFGQGPAWMPLLGIVEELGEAYEAIHAIERVPALANAASETLSDGLADLMIFVASYCTANGYALEEVLGYQAFPPAVHGQSVVQIIQGVGALCHAHLKRAQGIRGTPEERERKVRCALATVTHGVQRYADELGMDLLKVVETTWAQVKTRDWRADPVTGQTRPRPPA